MAQAGCRLREVRTQALQHLGGGLRELYRTLNLPGKSPLKGAHNALDIAVLKAYGLNEKCDLLGELLKLNQAVASRIEVGLPVNGPGIPSTYINPKALITEDAFGRTT